jgi:hypothetical protein
MGQSWSQPRDTERIAQDRHRIVDAAIFHKGACPTQSILRSTLGAREENHRLLRLRAAYTSKASQRTRGDSDPFLDPDLKHNSSFHSDFGATRRLPRG